MIYTGTRVALHAGLDSLLSRVLHTGESRELKILVPSFELAEEYKALGIDLEDRMDLSIVLTVKLSNGEEVYGEESDEASSEDSSGN